jgi:hypothetical protein
LLERVLAKTSAKLQTPPYQLGVDEAPHLYAFGMLRVAIAIAERVLDRVAEADVPKAQQSLAFARRVEAFRSGRVKSRPSPTERRKPIAGATRTDALGAVACAARIARENLRGRNDLSQSLLAVQVDIAVALLPPAGRAELAGWLDDLLIRVDCEMQIEGFWIASRADHLGWRHATFERCLWVGVDPDSRSRAWLMRLTDGNVGFGGWLDDQPAWWEGSAEAIAPHVPPPWRDPIQRASTR